MSIIKDLEKELKNTIKESGYELETLTLQTSNRPDLGEYQIHGAYKKIYPLY